MYNQRGRGRGRGYRTQRSNEGLHNVNSTQGLPPQKPPKRNISKHDNNCCTDVSFSLELEEAENVFFKDLKTIWSMLKICPHVINKLHQFFNTCYNPYVQVLRLVYNCQEFSNVKPKSLPHFIIDEFRNWAATNRNGIVHLLTPQVKLDAFKVISKQNSTILKSIVIECFELKQDNEMFMDSVKCLIEKKQYREACQYAALLYLHDKFKIEDFLIPLVLQDKFFAIEEFLEKSPQHQSELILWCDSILGNHSVKDALGAYFIMNGIPDIKLEKLHAKPWKKMMTKFVKTYKIPSDMTPNLVKRRNEGAVQFILYKKFIEKAFSDESYKEMIQEAVGNDEEMQKELVYQVCSFNELNEALRWAHFYNISRDAWPYGLRIFEENPEGDRPQSPKQEDNWDDEIIQKNIEYHKFSKTFDSIRLIDTEQTFRSFLDKGLNDVEVVGLDCEWKPSFGHKTNELALMQIATRRCVFIIDIVNLGNKVPHLWKELGNLLFNNHNILKLGFSFSGDFSLIRQTLKDITFSLKDEFLDLCSLWKQLDKYSMIKLPFEVSSGGPSLTTLVQHCFGKPLDKSEQFSNWEKRPLRQNQLMYAALDAHVLIEVFDVLRDLFQKAGCNFDEVCFQTMGSDHKLKKKSKNANKKKMYASKASTPQPPSPIVSPVKPDQIKLVCDTMLQGLGKHLRRIGVDCAILQNHEDHKECVRFSQDENRFILSRGNIYNMLSGYVPQGYCLNVISDDVDEQLKQVIDYYKIQVSKDYVFSRCCICNGNSFIKVSRSTMHALINSSRSKLSGPTDYFEEEAFGYSSDEEAFEPSLPVSATRKWDLYSDEKLDVGLCKTKLGAVIQVLNIPNTVLKKNDLFYVCEECGKVFWDGSHFEAVLQGRLKGVVH